MKKIIILLFLLSSFVIVNAQCWKMLSNGDEHTLAIKTDGSLWAWGTNNYGELGIGASPYINMLYPAQVGAAKDWKYVSTGHDYSLALKNDGTLWAWGDNSHWQLGDSNYAAPNIPVQIGSANDWKVVSAGINSSFAIKNDGTLWAWGDNFYYQLGDGTRNARKIPVKVGTDTNWQQISYTAVFAMALKTDGTLWGWGNNSDGEIGIGNMDYIVTPVQAGTDNDWKTISAGYAFCMALKKDSTLWTWGDNEYGQLGDGKYPVLVPTEMDSGSKWKSISAMAGSSFAIKADGTLWAWGYNYDNELGIGNLVHPTYNRILAPVSVDTSTDWESISSALSETASAIKNNGELWSWEVNNTGQIGNYTTTNSAIPVRISCNSGLPIVLISFTAQKQHETTLLNWQTATEQNNKEYQIERSQNGNTFNTIGIVPSNNNISGSRYSYVDAHPLTGNNYYRLKSVDIDGKYSYSNIDEVIFTQSNEFAIYPNPAKDAITVENNFKGNTLNILITDLAGRKITQLIKPNNSVLRLSVADLRTGIYLLKITDGINSITRKLVKE